jgi:hypothetical protein
LASTLDRLRANRNPGIENPTVISQLEETSTL